MSDGSLLADNAIECVTKALLRDNKEEEVFDSFGNEIIDALLVDFIFSDVVSMEYKDYKEESTTKHSFYAYLICQDITGVEFLVQGIFYAYYMLDKDFIRLEFDKVKETKIYV